MCITWELYEIFNNAKQFMNFHEKDRNKLGPPKEKLLSPFFN